MEQTYLSGQEIYQQHVELTKTMEYLWEKKEEVKAFFEGKDNIVFLASGSSYWMSLSASITLHHKTGKKCWAVKAGDVILCPEEYKGIYENPVLICPSRSGLTGEVLGAIDTLRSYYPGLKILSLVEYPEATLSKISDLPLHMEWANEKSVCQTRSFSCLYAACLLIADTVAGETDFYDELTRYLQEAPALYEAHGRALAAQIATGEIEKIVCLASGRQYGVCIEGAYIVIEMAEHPANYFQLLEYRHGPIVTADTATAIFMTASKGNEKHEEKLAEEGKSAGAKIFVIGAQADYAHGCFPLWEGYSRELVALHGVFCLQAFAFHYAVYKGKNPDAPGSLVPFIVI